MTGFYRPPVDGVRLAALRYKAGLTQVTLAERAGVHVRSVQDAERLGTCSMPARQKLAAALGIGVDVKKQQVEGIRDPNADLVQRLQSDPHRMRKLAAAYLQQQGIAEAEPIRERRAG